MPTPVPTAMPTPVPTTIPTQIPTLRPTPFPTTMPTPIPTTMPTPVPTGPTPVPTTMPTPVPTFSPAAFFGAIPYGIQYNNVTESDLMARGCSSCYSDTYAGNTNSNDISSCAGPVLFVGARKYIYPWWWDSTFYLGAFGLASEVQRSTVLNTPHLSNGVYWYFTPGKSFGFLGDTNLQQYSADVGTTNPHSRLSWSLDNPFGGNRAGANTGLKSTTWQKVIWSCPNGTLQCTVSK